MDDVLKRKILLARAGIALRKLVYSLPSVHTPHFKHTVRIAKMNPSHSIDRRLSESANMAASSLLEISQMYPESGVLLDTIEYYPYQTAEREESQVEEELCSDFVCCGVTLPNLHALLSHYEESHVRMEDELTDMLPPIETMDEGRLSAFDTTVFRTMTHSKKQTAVGIGGSAGGMYGMRRPASVPVTNLAQDPSAIHTLRSILPPVLANETTDSSFKLIHTALSSTINPSRMGDFPSAEKANNPRKRPYVCRIEGCDKTYKNPNGLKYHMQHGHDREGKESGDKPYRCPVPKCDKQYKNANGLKYHSQHGHQEDTLQKTIATIKSISGIAELSRFEAALKKERALRAAKAAAAPKSDFASTQPAAPWN